ARTSVALDVTPMLRGRSIRYDRVRNAARLVPRLRLRGDNLHRLDSEAMVWYFCNRETRLASVNNRMHPPVHRLAAAVILAIVLGFSTSQAQPRNVVFILSDDHRYDAMGFHENAPDFLRTPAMDKMAEEGVHIRNAFVTTSLCSPSRASILTGRYAHNHGVVDNQRLIPEGTVFFPQLLQDAGYETAFIGKWHMGEESDAPRPGFDHWLSFRGQGVYVDPVLNVNGERDTYRGHTTDILTDFAL